MSAVQATEHEVLAVGYVVLAVIAAVLCWSRRGRALIAAAGDALMVIIDDVRGRESAGGESHVERLGAWAAERDREIAARYRPATAWEAVARRRFHAQFREIPIVSGAVADDVLGPGCVVTVDRPIPSLVAARWRAIRSSEDTSWVM